MGMGKETTIISRQARSAPFVHCQYRNHIVMFYKAVVFTLFRFVYRTCRKKEAFLLPAI